MWTVIFVSQDEEKTSRLVGILSENGIMTRRKVSREDDFGTETAYEVLVPQTELETAHDIIFDSEIILK
ncbi:MAG: hypothetical protein ACI4DP_12480 [Candidatus Ornithomonoglobus sp.]